MKQGGAPAEQSARAVARMLDSEGIRQSGGKPFQWVTINAWRKKINKRLKAGWWFLEEGTDIAVWFWCQYLVGMKSLLEPPREPKKVARETLEYGLNYSAPPKLWGIDKLRGQFITGF